MLMENPIVRSEKTKAVNHLIKKLGSNSKVKESYIRWVFEEFENTESGFSWEDCKMVEDDNTVCKEIAGEIRDLAISFMPNDRARTLLEDKLKQLMRLLGDEL